MPEPTDPAYASALLRDLIALGVAPKHLLDRAVDIAAPAWARRRRSGRPAADGPVASTGGCA
jgi:hypothetical protein